MGSYNSVYVIDDYSSTKDVIELIERYEESEENV